ncbi:hypothetical protein L1887_50176 [Cichorium endivia]|nr:hypothetical protein L1887_50176 [Cichorium endivia]
MLEPRRSSTLRFRTTAAFPVHTALCDPCPRKASNHRGIFGVFLHSSSRARLSPTATSRHPLSAKHDMHHTAPTYGPPPARSKFDIRMQREDVIVPDFTTSCCAQISSDVDRSPRATLCSEPGPPRISKLFPFTGVHLVLRGLGWTLRSRWDPIRSSTSAGPIRCALPCVVIDLPLPLHTLSSQCKTVDQTSAMTSAAATSWVGTLLNQASSGKIFPRPDQRPDFVLLSLLKSTPPSSATSTKQAS